jgi:NAD(P)-dependent dehydrogenase (short-subunit alcohol dehydrogenase family)
MAVVLITGCSSGFGMLASLVFARKGDTVYASMRDTAKSAALEEAAAKENLKVNVIQLDVNDERSVQAAVAKVVDAEGRIDVLVNNAGIGHHGPIEETDDGEVREIFETNTFGPLRAIRAVAPAMRAQKAGVIANVSSLAGVVCPPFEGIYSGTKHALEALSEALYYELHPFGVRVLLIEPGGFSTNIENTRRYPKAYGEGSPYAELDQRFEKALTRLPAAAERADPQIVADLIYDAVNDKEPKLRYLVGQDAEMIGGLRRQMDDATFEKTMRQSLDFWD